MPRLSVVFQIGSLGDSILSLPSLKSLRDLVPDCDEYVLVDRYDDATKVVPLEVFEMVWRPRQRVSYRGSGPRLGRIISIASLGRQLRYYRPYYGIYLMPSDRTAVQIRRDRTFFRATGVREFIGFRTPGEEEGAKQECPNIRCSEAYRRFRRLWNEQTDEKFAIHGRVPLLKPDREACSHVAEWLDLNRRFNGRLLVAVCPFSNCSSKDLSSEAAAELIERLENDAGVEAVLVGGAKDNSLGSWVVERARAGLNGCGKFSVGEAAALLQKCSLAIGADSGPMHLAAAVGTPTIVVYSRTNEHLDRWFPLGGGHTILYRELECAGCEVHRCPIMSHPCMRDIKVDQIFAVTMRKLKGLPVSSSDNGTMVLNL
jgi:ADP-heptose:LPS heptosyltransferase